MSKIKKLFFILISFAIGIALIFLIVCVLYNYGVIARQDIQTTNIGVHASVGLRKGEDPFHYTTGFFITKNKVVTALLTNYEGFDFKILDLEENKYNVIDIKTYKNIVVMTTDKDNMSDVKYLYGFPKKNDMVKAFIKKTKSVNQLSDCKVINTNYKYNGIRYSICTNKVEGNSGGAVIDKYGRILGMAVSAGEREIFYIYPQYEIMKQIIIDDIKDFLK